MGTKKIVKRSTKKAAARKHVGKRALPKSNVKRPSRGICGSTTLPGTEFPSWMSSL